MNFTQKRINFVGWQHHATACNSEGLQSQPFILNVRLQYYKIIITVIILPYFSTIIIIVIIMIIIIVNITIIIINIIIIIRVFSQYKRLQGGKNRRSWAALAALSAATNKAEEQAASLSAV